MKTLSHHYLLMSALALSTISVTDTKAQDEIQCGAAVRALDCELKEAFENRSLNEFRRLLVEKGADPTVRLENVRNDWLYCAATQPGREEYLKLIIDEGFDVNFRLASIHSSKSLPLTCAVLFSNLGALELLVAAGADPATRMCVACENKMDSSVLDKAAIVSKYDLAIWLLDKGNYSDEQIETVITGLEIFPVDESNPRNHLRLELADRIRAMGYEVEPWTKNKTTD